MKFKINMGLYVHNPETKKNEIKAEIKLESDQIRSGNDLILFLINSRNEYIQEKFIVNSLDCIENDLDFLKNQDDLVKIYVEVIGRLEDFPLPNMLDSKELSRIVDPFRNSMYFFKMDQI